MTSFHPTLSPLALLTYLWRTIVRNETVHISSFPGHTTVLTDSGTSAFAIVVETFALEGKTIILPAYVCDTFFPVLETYNIKPLFIDIDEETFHPKKSAYGDEILAQADAVLLVATYGKTPDRAIIEHLKQKGLLVIEDYAPCGPFLGEPLAGDARIYSLPKTMPVPDGGLAILPTSISLPDLQPHKHSLGFVKNVLKLLPLIAPLIAFIRDRKDRPQTKPSWSGINHASALTHTILLEYESHTSAVPLDTVFPYCVPLKLTNPKKGLSILRYNGISAERIWQQPIVMNEDVQKTYNLSVSDFPNTQKSAAHILCAPLWHIPDTTALKRYNQQLQETLSDQLCE